MTRQRRPAPVSRWRRVVEMGVFAVASVIGTYALGRGVNGLFERGSGLDLIWLAIAGVAIWVLFAQMGRVQDAWPRRDPDGSRAGGPQGGADEASQKALAAPGAQEMWKL